GATTYNLYRATAAGAEGITPYRTGIAATAITDTGLTNGTTYFYRVSAVNNVGEGALSAEVSATPSAANSPVAYHINAGGPAGGPNRAVIREFIVTADSNGNVGINFNAAAGTYPLVCAIEVIPYSQQVPPTPTGVTATAGNAQIVLNWASVSSATTYTVYRSL